MDEKAKESLNKAGNICLFVKENSGDEQTARYMAEAIAAINEAVKYYEAEKLEWEENESWHGIARGFALHDAMTDERLNKLMQASAAIREALEYVLHMDDNGYTSFDVKTAIKKAKFAIAAAKGGA